MLKCYSGEYKITDFQAWNNCLRRALRITLRLLWINCFCCWVTQSCPTLCDPMDCSTPGFPVLHHLPEFAQTHVHWVNGAIQPSHPLSSPFPPALNLSQHQGLFQWVGSSHQVAKVLEFHLPMTLQGWFPLGLTGLIAWQSKRLSRVYSWVYIKIIESRGWNRHLYTCVHSSIIHSSQKVEMTQVSIHRWVDKQNTVYANIRIWPNF